MLGITDEGSKEILGINNKTSKYWLSLLYEIKKRGIEDGLIFALDGLNGFNKVIQTIYPKA
ncbi:MAG: transposase [Campylobacteraceae bacterium]|nr:transposase [Campylobacteraceae bacterium]